VGANEDVEPIVGPDAHLVARHADNAGIPRLINFDLGSAVQPQFSQPVDMVQMSVHPADPRELPGPKQLNRYKPVNHITAEVGEGVPTKNETHSHYRIILGHPGTDCKPITEFRN
jgi:hypothetical protein